MESIVNDDRIEKGARVGKIATFVGLGFLGIGLVVSLVMRESPLLWLSFLCLLVGIIISSVGTANMNRWVKEPRADQALEQGLKGFDKKYLLYNHFLPAPHVLLTPLGLYVLTAMGQEGTIRFDGTKFHRDFSLGRVLRFMAEEGLGKPLQEADSQVKDLREYLEENEIEDGISVQNIVVFYNPKAVLEINSPPLPVTNTKGLKKAVRRLQSGKNQAGRITAAQYSQLRELFDDEIEYY